MSSDVGAAVEADPACGEGVARRLGLEAPEARVA